MVFDAMKIKSPILPGTMPKGASTVIVDPPWDVQQHGNYGAVNHYKLMTLEQI